MSLQLSAEFIRSHNVIIHKTNKFLKMNGFTNRYNKQITKTTKMRGTVSERFKHVKNFCLECVSQTIGILKMHFLDI